MVLGLLCLDNLWTKVSGQFRILFWHSWVLYFGKLGGPLGGANGFVVLVNLGIIWSCFSLDKYKRSFGNTNIK